MSELMTTIRALLNLGAGTPDTDVTAAVSRLRDLEREVVSLTGAKSTEEAQGAVRAMAATATKVEGLTADLAKVRSERDKQNFDALIMNGQSARKLTPALVTNVWQPEFDAAQATGNGEAVVNRLKGFLTHAPIVIGQAPKQPAVNHKDNPAQALTANGKTYDEMSYSARAKLQKEDPELFAVMKQDFDARNAA